MSKYLNNAFKALDLLEDTDFKLDSDKTFDELSEFVKDDVDMEDEEPLEVIDTDVEKNEQPVAHVDDIVLQCCSCGSNIFKAEDDITIEDGAECCCVGEECPICASTDGFKIIGKVAPYKEEHDVELSDDDKDVDIDLTSDENDSDDDEDKEYKKDKKEETVKEIKERLWRRARLNKKLNESRHFISKGRKLDEAIPKDLAHAYKIDHTLHRGIGRTPFYKYKSLNNDNADYYKDLDHGEFSTVDWQNADYKKLTSEQALALPKKDRKNVRVVNVSGRYVPLNNAGTSEAGNSYNSYEKIVNDSPKAIYYTTNENPHDSPIPADKQARHNNTGDDYDSNFGSHEFCVSHDRSNIKMYAEKLADAENNYATALKDFNDGKISQSKLDDYVEKINRYKSNIAYYKNDLKNTKLKNKDIRRRKEYSQLQLTNVFNNKRKELASIKNDTDDINRKLDKTIEGRKYFRKGAIDSIDTYVLPDDLEHIVYKKSKLNTLKRNIDDLNERITSAKNEIAEINNEYHLDADNSDNEILKKFDDSIEDLQNRADEARDKIDILLNRKPATESFNRSNMRKRMARRRMQEAIENATIETDHDILHLSAEEKENADKSEEDFMLKPLSDEEQDNLLNKDIESSDTELPEDDKDFLNGEDTESENAMNPEDENDEEPENLETESFNKVTEKYLKNCYSNVTNFKATKVRRNKNESLVVEGCITFKSGKKKKTAFTFTESIKHDIGKRNKRFIGMNESFTNKKKAYILEGVVDNKTLSTTKLIYLYPAKKHGLNESVKMFKGIVKA